MNGQPTLVASRYCTRFRPTARRSLDFHWAEHDDARMRILAGLCFLMLPFHEGSAQPTTLRGAVTDSSGRPLAGAEVRLVDGGTEVSVARTGEDGRFAVAGVIRRRTGLHVQLVGFKPAAVELFFPRDSLRLLSIELEPASRNVGESEESDSSSAARLQKFYERRRSNSYGHYFTRQEIVARLPQYLSEMLRTVPGVTISSRVGGFRIRMRGCRYAPIVWIDGTRTPDSELDDVARVDDVAAMEVYTTPAGTPAQYLDRSNVGCGTILIWSRQ